MPQIAEFNVPENGTSMSRKTGTIKYIYRIHLCFKVTKSEILKKLIHITSIDFHNLGAISRCRAVDLLSCS